MGSRLPLPLSAALITAARLGFCGAWSLLILFLLFVWLSGNMTSESIETDRAIEGLARGDSTLAAFRLTL